MASTCDSLLFAASLAALLFYPLHGLQTFGTCADRRGASYCSSYVRLGMCHDGLLTEPCALSCKFCSPTKPCVDIFSQATCSMMRYTRMCDHKETVMSMQKNCRKTCGHCDTPTDKPVEPSRITPNVVIKTKPTILPTVNPNLPCRDSYGACNLYVAYGYCTHPERVGFMTRNCPSACGFCIPSPTEDPCFDEYDPLVCHLYLNIGFCTHPDHKAVARRLCRATCGVCKPTKVLTTDNAGSTNPQPTSASRASTSKLHTTSPSATTAAKLSTIGSTPAQSTSKPSELPTTETTTTSKPTTVQLTTEPSTTASSTQPMTQKPCVDANVTKCAEFAAAGLCTQEIFQQMMLINCPRTCSLCPQPKCPDTFSCSLECLPEKLKCDGVKDCPDGSDEISCASVKVPICVKPKAVNGISIKSDRRANGDLVVSYSCNSGSLKGSATRVCSLKSGKWDYEEPTCAI